jgi:acyl-CoA thioester hydrolase
VSQIHELPVRVYYEDTDAGGIVYHAGYIRFAERGRTEMLRDGGFRHAKLFEDKGIAFAVVSLNVNYKTPARLDDLLVVKTSISRLGGASLDMEQNIYRNETLICEIKVTLVCVDNTLKAVRLPEDLRRLYG